MTVIPQLFAATIAILVLALAALSRWGSTRQLIVGLASLVVFAIGSALVPSANSAVGWIIVIVAVAIAQLIAIFDYRRERRVSAEAARLNVLAESRQRDLLAIAHDLRNPIAFVSGIIDLLDRGELSPDEHTAIFARMGVVARRMDRTVVNLVDLGAIRDGRLEPTPRVGDLAPVLAEVVRENSSPAVGKMVSLDVDPGDSFPVLCDQLHLERILRNLVAGAIERSPEGGRISVSIKTADKRVRIVILDSGPDRDIGTLLALVGHEQPPEFESSGFQLALFVAARLAEANRARVEISSNEPAGLIVTLDLPAAPPPE